MARHDRATGSSPPRFRAAPGTMVPLPSQPAAIHRRARRPTGSAAALNRSWDADRCLVLWPLCLTIDLRHLLRAISRSRDSFGRERGVELPYLGGGETHVRRGDIFLEIPAALRARDRYDVRALVQQPRESNLTGGRAFASGELAYDRGRPHVRIEILALVPRIAAAEVALGIFLGAPNGSREKATAERCEWNESDLQLTKQWNDAWLEIPLPKRVLALKRRDGMHRVRPTNRLLTRLGETEEAHFPVAHEVRHRAHDFLDWDGGIDAMLVEEIDVVRS